MVSTRSKSSSKRVVTFADGDGESVVGSRSTRFASRQKLPGSTLKQLAEDIEHAGGIVEFDNGLTQGLNVLLDLRTYGDSDLNIYGKRGSKLRERVRKKVAKWRLLSVEEYLVILSKLGVLPASARQKQSLIKLSRGTAKEPKTKDVVDRPRRVPVASDVDQEILDKLNKVRISEKKIAPASTIPASKTPASKEVLKTEDAPKKTMSRTFLLVCSLQGHVLGSLTPAFFATLIFARFQRKQHDHH